MDWAREDTGQQRRLARDRCGCGSALPAHDRRCLPRAGARALDGGKTAALKQRRLAPRP